MTAIDSALLVRAVENAEREALVVGSLRWTYRTLDENVADLSRQLAAFGAGPRSRILVSLADPAAFVLTHLAVRRLRAAVAPLDPEMVVDDTLLGYLDPTLIVADGQSLRRLSMLDRYAAGSPLRRCPGAPQVLAADPESQLGLPHPESDLAAIALSSGTTAEPKGIMLSHDYFDAVAGAGSQVLVIEDEDRVALITPLFHFYSLREIETALIGGATLVVSPASVFIANTLEILIAERVTGFSAVPAIMEVFTSEPCAERLQVLGSRLKYLCIGTGKTSTALRRRLKALLPGTRITLTYGLTECSRVAFGDLRETPDGSVGRAFEGVEIAIVDEAGESLTALMEGRVRIRSPAAFDGYWKSASLSRQMILEDGWLGTSDLGYLDDDGYLFLNGRADDLLNIGGRKVYPAEIEGALRRHPAVRDVAVCSVADEVLGEVAVACVVVQAAGLVGSPDLIRFCGERLEPYKCPRRIAIVEALPRTALGKVDRRRLRMLAQTA